MCSPRSCTLSPRACGACGKREYLLKFLRCPGCQVVYYCGRDHQVEDQIFHKEKCDEAKKARVLLEQEEKAVRDYPGGGLLPDNIFENCVGHFWGIVVTRDYMCARYQLANTLLSAFGGSGGLVDAVQTALDHFLDMLRLSRSDEMGVRNVVPALLIRLNKDQEAYDFVRWYATTGDPDHCDWDDLNLPYLNIKDADVLEAPAEKWVNSRWIDLSHVVAVILIKVRTLLDLQAALGIASRAFQALVPDEIIGLVRKQLVGSIVQSRPGILNGGTEGIAHRVETIKGQIRDLYEAVNEYNPYFWQLMLDHSVEAAATRPSHYSPKSEEEACLCVGKSLASWLETPGSFDVMRSVSQTA
ncbi:hypothetical protein CEP54_002660 [Fusarium duplospermum]|uniref:MYND-type domain-containing protein n=1 Tax=Fusarium duplospermum TaxID=1325734 RepID=A0A428QTG4_9HYPO|nr:hypothetical protein CEP54_002660 [Fusarium duplospermum]